MHKIQCARKLSPHGFSGNCGGIFLAHCSYCKDLGVIWGYFIWPVGIIFVTSTWQHWPFHRDPTLSVPGRECVSSTQWNPRYSSPRLFWSLCRRRQGLCVESVLSDFVNHESLVWLQHDLSLFDSPRTSLFFLRAEEKPDSSPEKRIAKSINTILENFYSITHHKKNNTEHMTQYTTETVMAKRRNRTEVNGKSLTHGAYLWMM